MTKFHCLIAFTSWYIRQFMCVVIISKPSCDVMKFEINVSTWPKCQAKNLNILRTKSAFKDTYRENASQNKTQTLRKNMNMDIWVVNTLNQLFIRGSFSKIKVKKIKQVHFALPILFVLTITFDLKIGFWKGSFVWKYCVFNRSTFN